MAEQEERAEERAKLQDRIEELEKNLSYEVEQKIKLADTLRDERAKRPDLPCDGGCNVNDGPMEECSRHGRTPRDLWGIIEDLIQWLATERAKRPTPEAHEVTDAEVVAAYSAFVQTSFGFPGAPAMRAALEASRGVSGARLPEE